MNKFFKYLLSIALIFTILACSEENTTTPDNEGQASSYSSKIVSDWINLSLDLNQHCAGFTPPVGARTFGYTGLALYQAIVPGMPTYGSLSGRINQYSSSLKIESGKEYNWEIVANSTLATIMTKLYSNATDEYKNKIVALEEEYNNKVKATVSQEVYDRSVAWGKSVAMEVYDFSKTDDQEFAYLHNIDSLYIPTAGPGKWKPTPAKYQPALQPHWGDVRTFVVGVADATMPVAPPAYSEDSTSKYIMEAKEVYNTCVNLTDEQRYIAFFWADNPLESPTPPGHSMSILSQILVQTNANLEKAAEAYARMGMGQHDAFVSCWKAKFVYEFIRPVTVIQALWAPTFQTDVVTPPFPEYPSGHSTQSGAMVSIMSSLFGANLAFTDKTHDGRVVSGTTLMPRPFTSFEAAAQETAISRLYGGIHFRSAIEKGIDQGKLVGNKILAINFKK